MVDEKTQKKEKLEDPIIRLDIPYDNEDPTSQAKIINKNAISTCDIYDATKKIPNCRPDKVPFEKATWPKPKKMDNGETILVDTPITYETIGQFITAGSACSGTVDLSTICLSSLGVSLKAPVTTVIVKRSTGFKPNPVDIFTSHEFDMMGEASTEIVIERDESQKTLESLSTDVAADLLGDMNFNDDDE